MIYANVFIKYRPGYTLLQSPFEDYVLPDIGKPSKKNSRGKMFRSPFEDYILPDGRGSMKPFYQDEWVSIPFRGLDASGLKGAVNQ